MLRLVLSLLSLPLVQWEGSNSTGQVHRCGGFLSYLLLETVALEELGFSGLSPSSVGGWQNLVIIFLPFIKAMVHMSEFSLNFWSECVSKKDKNNNDEKEVELFSGVLSMGVKEAHKRSKVISWHREINKNVLLALYSILSLSVTVYSRTS